MRFPNHSQRNIGEALKISRDTVRRIFNAADSKKFKAGHRSRISMKCDVQNLLLEEEVKNQLSIKQRFLIMFIRNCWKPGTTIKLLGEEYGENCQSINVPFYQYSYFVKDIVTMLKEQSDHAYQSQAGRQDDGGLNGTYVHL